MTAPIHSIRFRTRSLPHALLLLTATALLLLFAMPARTQDSGTPPQSTAQADAQDVQAPCANQSCVQAATNTVTGVDQEPPYESSPSSFTASQVTTALQVGSVGLTVTAQSASAELGAFMVGGSTLLGGGADLVSIGNGGFSGYQTGGIPGAISGAVKQTVVCAADAAVTAAVSATCGPVVGIVAGKAAGEATQYVLDNPPTNLPTDVYACAKAGDCDQEESIPDSGVVIDSPTGSTTSQSPSSGSSNDLIQDFQAAGIDTSPSNEGSASDITSSDLESLSSFSSSGDNSSSSIDVNEVQSEATQWDQQQAAKEQAAQQAEQQAQAAAQAAAEAQAQAPQVLYSNSGGGNSEQTPTPQSAPQPAETSRASSILGFVQMLGSAYLGVRAAQHAARAANSPPQTAARQAPEVAPCRNASVNTTC